MGIYPAVTSYDAMTCMLYYCKQNNLFISLFDFLAICQMVNILKRRAYPFDTICISLDVIPVRSDDV